VGYFEGYYVKCTGARGTVAVIFGEAKRGGNKTAFIQIITKDNSYNKNFDHQEFSISRREFDVRAGVNHANKKGMLLDINSEDLKISGDIKFGEFGPIEYDAMGPFRFLPFMECRHTVVSMRHKISGKISINGVEHNFDDGVGYIEGDRGKGFPRKYFWSQVNEGNISVSASCAIIPYFGIRFKGTICFIHVNGQKLRIATYCGARVKTFNESKLVIIQGRRKKKRYRLEILSLDKRGTNDRSLWAPMRGEMKRVIQESVERKVNYKLTRGSQTIFDFTSDRAALEFSDLG